MTGADTEQRLQAAEAELTELRIEVAKLNVLVGVLLHEDPDKQANVDANRIMTAINRPSPRVRPQLRLVDDAGSVSGQDLDEGLRRVRAARGEAR